MRLIDWFRPEIRLKRWLLIGVIGIICISFGLAFMVREIYMSLLEKMLSLFLMLAGCVFILIAVRYVVKTFFNAIENSGFKVSLDANRLSNLIFEKRIQIKGPKIVAIGGGTGLSTMLRGLKAFSSNITAVVSVSDDGGGSGVLRQDLGILPPGDIRNCVLALADTEPILEQLLQYRFKDGMLKGQNFGNLFLAAMDGISSSFEEAVHKMSDVLAVTGKVLPVTLDNIRLCAELEDGHIICGESSIGKHNSFHSGKIKRVYLEPETVKPLKEVLDAINEADMILMGPGSLYTSIIPNLLIKGIRDSLKKSKALKVYVCNIMTQPGETEGFTVSEHIKAIEKHTYKGIINYCIANVASIPEDLKIKYWNERAEVVKTDEKEINIMGVKLIVGDYVSIFNNYFIRHDAPKLAETLIDLIAETILVNDKKRIIDYYYIKDRLKKSKN